ncbi:cupin domain-containing protein [Massilia niastensis]|uniref:cupin domain-containing protein n=1 Tax=Massilia niastensis TaxID=544911 RepID=UPI0003639235|nr:cupin domain-containing protein [Massilia niastensis]
MSITQLSTALRQQDMHAIGPVTNLGATVESGNVEAYALGTFGAPADPVSAGYFGVTRGVFRMTYPFNEQATVVHGVVTLTDVAAGTSATYRTGDSWFVTQGTEVLWEIDSDFFIKHFFAVVK